MAPGRPKMGALVGVSVAVTLTVAAVAAGVGAVAIAPWDVLTTVLALVGLPVTPTATASEVRILQGVRLPRVAVAWLAGLGLGLSGALLAGGFRNRLAEPTTAGSAAGALLGASVVLAAGPLALFHTVSGGPSLASLVLRGMVATGMAAAATWLVWRTARTGLALAPAPLLLAGMAVNALVGSLAALFLFLGPAGTQTAAAVVVTWMFGGVLAEATHVAVVPLAIAVALAGVLGWFSRHELDVLAAGEEEAVASGVDLPRTRTLVVGAAALATGFAVAFAGVVAFVGLLAPNLVRRWSGPSHARLVPIAALGGATLLVGADALGRVLAAPAELPAGVVTAFLGAPILLVLLRRGLREVIAG